MRRMTLFVVALILAVPGFVGAEETTLVVKTPVANVRVQPDNNSQVIMKVKQGTELVASARKGEWYELLIKDSQGKPMKGYIHESTVEQKKDVEVKPSKPERAPSRQKPTQTKAAEEWKLPAFLKGFRVSLMPALTSMNFSDELQPGESKKSRFALGGGISYERKVYRLFYASTGLWLSPGGSVIDSDALKVTMSGYALTLPLLIKARFLEGYSPTIFVGGQFGYILSHRFRTLNKVTLETTDTDMTEEVNRIYYGLVGGVGFEYPFRSLMLVAEVQYHLGLSNLVKNPDPGESAKTSSIVLSLGVKAK